MPILSRRKRKIEGGGVSSKDDRRLDQSTLENEGESNMEGSSKQCDSPSDVNEPVKVELVDGAEDDDKDEVMVDHEQNNQEDALSNSSANLSDSGRSEDVQDDVEEENQGRQQADDEHNSQGSLEDVLTPNGESDANVDITPLQPSKEKRVLTRRKTHKADCPRNPSKKLFCTPTYRKGVNVLQNPKKSRGRPKNSKRKQDFQARNIDEQGVWVKCENRECRKWRYLSDVTDPVEVDPLWTCAMHPDKAFSSCDKPEEDYSELDFVHNRFTEGSIVWAKLHGYPWWPAMVEENPDSGDFMLYDEDMDSEVTHYHCVFMDKTVSRAWVAAMFVKKFHDHGNPPGSLTMKKKKNFINQMSYAKEQAKESLKLSIKERIETFGFSKNFKGVWRENSQPQDKDIDMGDAEANEIIGDMLSSEDMEGLLSETKGLLDEAMELLDENVTGNTVQPKRKEPKHDSKAKSRLGRKRKSCVEEDPSSKSKKKKHKKKGSKHETEEAKVARKELKKQKKKEKQLKSQNTVTEGSCSSDVRCSKHQSDGRGSLDVKKDHHMDPEELNEMEEEADSRETTSREGQEETTKEKQKSKEMENEKEEPDEEAESVEEEKKTEEPDEAADRLETATDDGEAGLTEEKQKLGEKDKFDDDVDRCETNDEMEEKTTDEKQESLGGEKNKVKNKIDEKVSNKQEDTKMLCAKDIVGKEESSMKMEKGNKIRREGREQKRKETEEKKKQAEMERELKLKERETKKMKKQQQLKEKEEKLKEKEQKKIQMMEEKEKKKKEREEKKHLQVPQKKKKMEKKSTDVAATSLGQTIVVDDKKIMKKKNNIVAHERKSKGFVAPKQVKTTPEETKECVEKVKSTSTTSTFQATAASGAQVSTDKRHDDTGEKKKEVTTTLEKKVTYAAQKTKKKKFSVKRKEPSTGEEKKLDGFPREKARDDLPQTIKTCLEQKTEKCMNDEIAGSEENNNDEKRRTPTDQTQQADSSMSGEQNGDKNKKIDNEKCSKEEIAGRHKNSANKYEKTHADQAQPADSSNHGEENGGNHGEANHGNHGEENHGKDKKIENDKLVNITEGKDVEVEQANGIGCEAENEVDDDDLNDSLDLDWSDTPIVPSKKLVTPAMDDEDSDPFEAVEE